MKYDRRVQLGYREVLRRIHEDLRPNVYCEIGVHYGHSAILAEPGTRIIGIDPNPTIEVDLLPDTSIYELTSDDFFDQHTVAGAAGSPSDMTFIDGRHLFEFSLRDFRNAERNSGKNGVILFHDCAPPLEWSDREVRSGDAWRLAAALSEF